MDEPIEICVEHRGQTKCFPAVFSKYGYSYRITITILDTNVIFEPDEERQWRARIENNTPMTRDLQELVPLIAAELDENLQ
jgi:hypothetical protein